MYGTSINSTEAFARNTSATIMAGISFITYDILLILVTIICLGKVAPCSTFFYCFQKWLPKNEFWNKAKRTPLFIGIVLQIIVVYIMFRVATSANEIVYYSLCFVDFDYYVGSTWHTLNVMLELIGYYFFYIVYTLFVAVFLKGGLIWMYNPKHKLSIIIVSSIIMILLCIVTLLFMIISCILYLTVATRIYVYFSGGGTAVVYIISCTILTIMSFIVSIALIVVIVKSNSSKAKFISRRQKAEQQIVVVKLLVSNMFLFISNLVRLLGAILFAANFYFYVVLIMRTIPDALIICGIFGVFWPFRLLPKCCFAERKSKVTLFFDKVAESYDMIDHFDEMTDEDDNVTVVSDVQEVPSKVIVALEETISTPTTEQHQQQQQQDIKQ